MKAYMIIVTYFMKKGKREQFVNEVINHGLLEQIRNEEGCLSYEYYDSVSDLDCLMLIEKWSCVNAQQIHLQQPHMKVLKEIKDKYVLQTVIETTVIDVQ